MRSCFNDSAARKSPRPCTISWSSAAWLTNRVGRSPIAQSALEWRWDYRKARRKSQLPVPAPASVTSLAVRTPIRGRRIVYSKSRPCSAAKRLAPVWIGSKSAVLNIGWRLPVFTDKQTVSELAGLRMRAKNRPSPFRTTDSSCSFIAEFSAGHAKIPANVDHANLLTVQRLVTASQIRKPRMP
jgi:hypothetical protein